MSFPIVCRTEKGDEELRSRRHGLGRDLRFVLILVDGHSPVDELAQKADGWDVKSSLRELARQGFVTLGDESPPEAGDVPAIKGRLIRIAEELLGDNAPAIVEKLRAAPDTAEGLKSAAEHCRRMVRLLIDESLAEQMEARCRALLMTL